MKSLLAAQFLMMAASVARAADSPRQHLSMDPGWMFSKGDVAEAKNAAVDDKGWRKLDLPHDWSIEGPYDQAALTGGQGGFLPAGFGWYRKHFVTPADWKGKVVTVQ